MPGNADRKYAFPEPVAGDLKDELKYRLAVILRTTAGGLELTMKPEAKALYEEWYLNGQHNSIHARRLDTYAVRFMILFAINDMKETIEVETVKKAIAVCEWQYKVRQLYDPIDAESRIAMMEEKIRRVLKIKGPLSDRELKQQTHGNRAGLWLYEQAKQNLKRSTELRQDPRDKGEGCAMSVKTVAKPVAIFVNLRKPLREKGIQRIFRPFPPLNPVGRFKYR